VLPEVHKPTKIPSKVCCPRPHIRLSKEQQVARMYNVFGRWILSSKCYLASFIAITLTAFLMWPKIILEFNRNILWNINDVRAAVSEEFPIITETGLHQHNTSLAATLVGWFEGGVNLGLLPMTISEEESNLFCACHLLNCDEGQGQWWSQAFCTK
jgi:hypothetical protein